MKDSAERNNTDPVRQVYLEMKAHQLVRNWANEVMDARMKYGLPDCDQDTECTGKTEWYKKVKHAICSYALKELNSASNANKKSNMICHKVLEYQDYVTSIDPKLAKTLFKARLRMFDIKYNFKRKYHTRTDLLCSVCAASDENLQHIATSSLNSHNKIYGIKSK